MLSVEKSQKFNRLSGAVWQMMLVCLSRFAETV